MGSNNRALLSGLFLTILLAATTSVVYWLGHLERERDIYIVSTQASVSGLNPESTVFFRGIAVGKVLNIRFDPENSGIILIKIEVDKNIMFTKGVYATLHLKGVTGLTQLDLGDSGKITEKLPPGDNVVNRIPLMPSVTDRLLDSGDELLKKADHLMIRLSSLLNEENEENIVGILANLKTLSDKLADLQSSVEKALLGIPALTTDARKTLKNIDALAGDLQTLSKEAKNLSKKVGAVADTGNVASNQFIQTTLPKVNQLLTELQATTEQVKRVAETLGNNPQSVLLGLEQQEPGPGEPGYEEPK
ncbi:MlaD family protein [Methyloglobulus sp.]|uniref:MlaD family protein n=1 Tax=Methyloglobulus sp. TaxID=2518622 RepID=UPI003988F610